MLPGLYMSKTTIGILLSMQRLNAVESMICKRLARASENVSRSNRLASGYVFGLRSYTPSTLVAFRITSARIFLARRAAVVSVEKYGIPVPAANIAMWDNHRSRI